MSAVRAAKQRTGHRASRARGLTLIEMMIALALSAFLLLGLVQVFGASKSAYATSDALARIQENSRFALDFVQRDVRMIGHMGCVSDASRYLDGGTEVRNRLFASPSGGPPPTVFPEDVAPTSLRDFALSFKIPVEGYEATGTGVGASIDRSATTNPTAASAATDYSPNVNASLWAELNSGDVRPVAGSDILVVRFFGVESVPASYIGAANEITLSHAPTDANFVVQNGMYGISDCLGASMFQATSAYNSGTRKFTAATSGLNRRDFGTELYPEGGHLFRAESYVYFVGISATRAVPSLYRLEYDYTAAGVTGRKEELVEGVETMQLLYQWDLDRLNANQLPDGDPEALATAATVGAWASAPRTRIDAWRRVGAVRLGLLIRGEQGVGAPVRNETSGATSLGAAYAVLGTNYTPPNDARVRQSYETTVALRNRLYGN